jgi:hypothetical protein
VLRVRERVRTRLGRLIAAGLLAGGTLAGCAGYSGTPAQRVTQWVKHESFFTNYDQLISDVQHMRLAVKIGTAEQLRTICGGFAYDVGTAYTTLPTPDITLTNALNDADQAFVSASTTCSAVSSVHAAGTVNALAEIRTGVGALSRAQHVLASLGITWKIQL